MGIHYDYKSTRGAKKLQKQHEREQRRRNRKTREVPVQKTAYEMQRSLVGSEMCIRDSTYTHIFLSHFHRLYFLPSM